MVFWLVDVGKSTQSRQASSNRPSSQGFRHPKFCQARLLDSTHPCAEESLSNQRTQSARSGIPGADYVTVALDTDHAPGGMIKFPSRAPHKLQKIHAQRNPFLKRTAN